MSSRKIGLTEKLVIYFLVIAIPAITIISLFAWNRAKEALLQRTKDQLISVRVEKELALQRFFDDQMLLASRLAASNNLNRLIERSIKINLTNANPSQTGAIYDSLLNEIYRVNLGSLTAFQWIWIGKPGQKSLFFNLQGSQSLHPEYTIHELEIPELKDSFKQGIIETPNNPNFPATPLTVLYPLLTNNTLLIAGIDTIQLNQLMLNRNPYNGLGKTGESYLINQKHEMITSSRFNSHKGKKIEVNTIGVTRALKNDTATGIYLDYRGIEVIGSFAPVVYSGFKGVITAEIDSAEAFASLSKFLRDLLFIGIFSFSALFIAAITIALRMTRPLRLLKEASARMALGELHQKVEIISTDEIAELTETFNTMSTAIFEKSQLIEQERQERVRNLIDGQEKERQRLAREIHDSLGQTLLAANLMLSRAKESNDTEKKELISSASELIRGSIAESRAIINNLRPPVISELGIEEAIKALCREMNLSTGLEITLKIEELPVNLPEHVKIYLFRILQEALNNIQKHAQATQVSIQFSRTTSTVRLFIKDNGKGIHKLTHLKAGNGISNMRDRTQLLDGTFRIDNCGTSGSGTCITIDIPYNSKDE